MALEVDTHASSRRKAVKVAVAALSYEVGFGEAEDMAVETLREMLQSFLTEVGRSARAYTELAGRTESMLSDVVMALVDMGVKVDAIPAHAKRYNKSIFIPPTPSTPSPTLPTLQTGDKKAHPSHIPDFLPPFPDPHTYIRTLTHKQPSNEYQLIREKAASQKRDVERALTRFIAKTGETQSLFSDDMAAYPLIAVKPSPRAYLNALLPKDQDLDAQEPVETQQAVSKRQREARDGQSGSDAQTDTPVESTSFSQLLSQDSVDSDTIDNPYLRPVKFPKKRRR
ncbi:transcription initiation factor TFIID subunit 8-like [Haliotis cracherodii]|uniref:transcription initiation factor TFIID subunit 8-like n=1 Tax=Haliotis rufescens TaxID=6454 RepID=UPI001EB02012|nr:transcription initiation factor TFIID subunit 8-like [Haliotis rufescens]